LRTGRDNDVQRKRLIAAIAPIVCERGYEATTVTHLVDRAGVSRSVFYRYFTSKQACFLAALHDAQRDLLERVANGIEVQSCENATVAAITALATFAQDRPMAARMLMRETLAAGPQALDARDHGIDEIARLIDACLRTRRGSSTSALPTEIVIGTSCRAISSRSQLAESGRLAAVRGNLIEWITAYESHANVCSWQALAAAQAPARSPSLTRAPLRAPPAVPPGRPRHSAAAITENHRLRIVFAAAEVIGRDGYPASTVAAITHAAGVDTRSFYDLFTGKDDAFRVLRELAFQHAMAATAGAFFAVEDWPRRIWEAASAATQFLEQNPTLARACLVECEAGGSETVRRFEDILAGCTIFLEEGYRYRPLSGGSQPSQGVLDAIPQAALEVVYRRARSSSVAVMPGLTGQLAYVCLAPFVGAHADELIAGMSSS
jgi:AcrR family transcriptional regulator